MSKLIDMYNNLKKENSEKLYLFKSGMFYIFLDEDAQIISKLLHLKLTNLNSEIVKCGFPSNSLEKYLTLLELVPYNVQIIDNIANISYSPKQYSLNKSTKEFISTIASIDEESLSIVQAYEFISTIKSNAQKLLEENSSF